MVYRFLGVYHLANLLQELYLAKREGKARLHLNTSRIREAPVDRLSRRIQNTFWNTLTRRMDRGGIEAAAPDPKTSSTRPRIYIPPGAPEQHAYYSKIAEERLEFKLDVQWLPEGEWSGEYIQSLNERPGVLALDMVPSQGDIDDGDLEALPFIVPGGCFNELYNWDSAFCAIGMLESSTDVVKGIVRNFIFEIKHYGKILNANRSYYLGRSQPPFLTDLALRTYEATKLEPDAKDMLKEATLAAMKEYYTWWMTEPRLDPKTGLSRYRPIGIGAPPECASSSFAHVLRPYAEKYSMTIDEVYAAYNAQKIQAPALDEFFLHDRAVRENGHDVSNRVEGTCANLATVDLNTLLYKMEADISHIILTYFNDYLIVPEAFCAPGQLPDYVESSTTWARRARLRKSRMNGYCWNSSQGTFHDYNTFSKEPHLFESATGLWPLWAGLATLTQAAAVVTNLLPNLEEAGGLVSTSQRSRGPVSATNPQKQWDYPQGWAPHQMLAWDGLRRYGYYEVAERLCYKWISMVTNCARDFGGTVVEKYDVTGVTAPHRVDADYGNQGRKFEFCPMEGWVTYCSNPSAAVKTFLSD